MIQWTDHAQWSMRRYMGDQDGMVTINRAVAALADDPKPPEVFIRGRYHRLRTGQYRVQYTVDGDMVVILRVDRVL
jgi:Txe/YoeB family toxin of Txe-Axe toxin-antitoxin module